MTEDRRSYKSWEFWLTVVAMLVGGVIASGAIPEASPWMKVIGAVASMLSAMGYTGFRSWQKAAKANAEGLAALKAPPKDPT